MAGGFDSLGLMPELLRAIDDLGWLLPTDVQDESIPLILGGGDVMAAAETGSGKTAAFCLPIIQCVHERLREPSPTSPATASEGLSSVHSIKISENDKDAIFCITGDGLECSSSAEKMWAGARATHGVKNGKYFYEATISGTGISRLGWSTMAAHHELGKDAHGFGYGGTGMKSYNGSFVEYGSKYGNGDVIGCYIDWDSKEISYSVNGSPKGVAFEIPQSLLGSVMFPALVMKNCGAKLNFGSAPFRFPPRGEYSAISKADPTHIVSANAKAAFVVEGKHHPLAIILEPARDLAEQVYQNILEMTRYVADPAVKTVLLVGGGHGEEEKRSKKALEAGVDIVVGTLGKVCDMVKRKFLDLSQIRFFVLDEADRLTEAENMKEIMLLYNACPGGGTGDNRLQVCFFSATLHSPEITDLAGKICVNPTWVDLKGVDSVPDTVHHVIFRVDPVKHATLLTGQGGAIKAITDGVHVAGGRGGNGSDDKESQSEAIKQLKQQALLRIIDQFSMRKEHAYSCCVLGGMRSMTERRRNLEAFKEGLVRFLICTDVAARGIDVQGLPFVINMTLPAEPEHYIHRIGRVGRAERMGLAISIVASDGIQEKVWFHSCANRGKGCTNRKLKDQGGCAIWYDEPQLLEGVRARLHLDKIPELQEDYTLPPELASLGVEYGEEQQAGAGGAAGVGASAGCRLHEQLLRPAVLQLGQMEFDSQNMFFQIQMQFGR